MNQTDATDPFPQNQLELKDGIIIAHYHGDVTVDAIKRQGELTEALLNKAGKLVAPSILVVQDDYHLKISHADLAKVVNIPTVKRLSVVYVVGLRSTDATLVQLASQFFLNHKLIIAASFEEALAGAQALLHETRPILEQN